MNVKSLQRPKWMVGDKILLRQNPPLTQFFSKSNVNECEITKDQSGWWGDRIPL